MLAASWPCHTVPPVYQAQRSNSRPASPQFSSGAALKAKGRYLGCSSSASAGTPQHESSVQPSEVALSSYGPFRCSLPTTDMLQSLEMQRRADGRITITKVKSGSVIAEAGVQDGTVILAISDPVRKGKMWPLGAKSNLRMIVNLLKFQHGPSVELELLPPDGSKSQSGDSALGTGSPDAQQRYIKETLDQGQNEAEVQRRRKQQRDDYMAQSGSGGGNRRLVALAAIVVLLPPLMILAAAIATGYLDQLSDGYRGRY